MEQVRLVRPHNPGVEDMTYITMREGVYYLASTVHLAQRDSHLAIRSYHGEKVDISGGFPLELNWHKQGNILTATFSGMCGDAYYGNYRLLKARSPNI